MSKYDFNMENFNPNSSHWKILLRINPGSTVLEMGCAAGYMTKYMQQKLMCKVDVVDNDYESVVNAKQYAEHGFCLDLDSGDWDDMFDADKYDYILFADVLEHLRDPFTTLVKAKNLLKPDGRIIVSIPNICHNDIIIRLFYDRFTYTTYGILDDTHIHFWGEFDFRCMCKQAKLKRLETDKVYIATGGTEQRMSQDLVNPVLLDLLKHRADGEVFQWVFVLGKEHA